MADGVRTGLRALGLAALLALCACADEAKKRDSELTELLNLLPGNYDNGAQANSDPQNGVRPPHAHVALLIAKVYSPRLGHHVLFAQEIAAGDPLRVMSERLFSFTVDEKRGILESVYSFTDPLRWREGPEHLEMFTSVVAEDLRSVPGCELVWTKAGEGFSAAPDTKLCRDALALALSAALSADSLELAGYRFRKSH